MNKLKQFERIAKNTLTISTEFSATIAFAFVGGHFENKNDPEYNVHQYQSIPHFKRTLDINFH
jgi:hypothetical protein